MDEKSFACGDCGKCFSALVFLRRHRRVHTGEKPYSCSDCSKCFTQKSSLSTHKRVVHTGDKPFACEDCGKLFSVKANLLSHKNVHTGDRPFTCRDCGRCFSDNSHLSRHRKVHSGERRPLSTPRNVHTGHTGERRSLSHILLHGRVRVSEKTFSPSGFERHSSRENADTEDDLIIIPDEEKDLISSDSVEACSSKHLFGLDDPLSLEVDEEGKADVRNAQISLGELSEDLSVKEEVVIDEIPFVSVNEERFNRPIKMKVEEDVSSTANYYC